MYPICYQPTGVYKQFSIPHNTQEEKPSKLAARTPEELKKQKTLKIGLGVLALAGATVAVAYFSKGHSITKKVDKIVALITEGVDEADHPDKIKEAAANDADFAELYKLGQRYAKGLYGKVVGTLKKTRAFFAKHFYNY